jgi:copper chaperone CopZ
MITETYLVDGMTCGHCVAAVTEEVRTLDAVHDVAIDLATGAVTITSDGPLARDAVSAAVVEAGYELRP